MADDDLYSFEKKTVNPMRTSAGRGQSGYPGGVVGIGVGNTPLKTSSARKGIVPGTAAMSPNSREYGARPMTSVRAAGFTSHGRQGVTSGQSFDPFNQASDKPGSGEYGGSAGSQSSTQEEAIKSLERKVNSLIEESAVLCSPNFGNYNPVLGLEKAKEAGKKERALCKLREQANLGDQINLDLTYCVLFNLANAYHINRMYQDALNSYAVIVKNKLFNQSGRLRVNMGNIYFEQEKFSQAIKMYRMALDQIPNTNRDIRLKIMRNIGNAFVKMGQFQDAITSFEAVMETQPDSHTGFNLVLCYFALGDRDRMKKGFQKMVSTKPVSIEQYEDALGNPGNRSAVQSPDVNNDEMINQDSIEDHEVFNEDSLRAIARERRKAIERYIVLAAKLVAPNIENTFSMGYDWIVETIKNSPHAEIGNDLEIAKAIQFLKTKEFNKAIETLKAFEKKDQKLVGTAATNLSFLYILEGEYKQAEKYAEVAINHDRYNARAQTNRGNCYFIKGQYEKAKEHYIEANNVDALCAEAMYNLGLVNKKLKLYNEALQWFEKLHNILRNSAEVISQIADIYEKMGNSVQALEWYNILISVVPTDPGILCKLGDIFARENDKSHAFQYYQESYRYYPSNIDVISWLGAYFIECEVYEQAVHFFERASVIQPNEVKWQLMIASCYRRSGNYQQAFESYKRIHDKFPDNLECLRFLVRICTDLGMKDVHNYATKLAREEKNREQQEQEEQSLSRSENHSIEKGSKELGYDGPKIDPNPVWMKGSPKKIEAEVDFNEDVSHLLPD